MREGRIFIQTPALRVICATGFAAVLLCRAVLTVPPVLRPAVLALLVVSFAACFRKQSQQCSGWAD